MLLRVAVVLLFLQAALPAAIRVDRMTLTWDDLPLALSGTKAKLRLLNNQVVSGRVQDVSGSTITLRGRRGEVRTYPRQLVQDISVPGGKNALGCAMPAVGLFLSQMAGAPGAVGLGAAAGGYMVRKFVLKKEVRIEIMPDVAAAPARE
jgi:hypothetical protein